MGYGKKILKPDRDQNSVINRITGYEKRYSSDTGHENSSDGHFIFLPCYLSCYPRVQMTLGLETLAIGQVTLRNAAKSLQFALAQDILTLAEC